MAAGIRGRSRAVQDPAGVTVASGGTCRRRVGACRVPTDSINLARVNPQKRRVIFERLRAANPDPTTELEYTTPFELLVAVILSAQATDKGVNLATRKLFAVANTPQQLLALGQERLEDHIKTIGLYRTKAKNLLAACRMLLERHGGEVPRDREALEMLPGVGRKTANVVLNTAFGESTIAVDTHIFRVANRTGIAPGADVLEVERRLEKFTPDEFKRNAHHWLILHGRYVCVARKPRCPECIIRDLCEYRAKTPVAAASSAA
jgi:endonuclease-3